MRAGDGPPADLGRRYLDRKRNLLESLSASPLCTKEQFLSLGYANAHSMNWHLIACFPRWWLASVSLTIKPAPDWCALVSVGADQSVIVCCLPLHVYSLKGTKRTSDERKMIKNEQATILKSVTCCALFRPLSASSWFHCKYEITLK